MTPPRHRWRRGDRGPRPDSPVVQHLLEVWDTAWSTPVWTPAGMVVRIPARVGKHATWAARSAQHGWLSGGAASGIEFETRRAAQRALLARVLPGYSISPTEDEGMDTEIPYTNPPVQRVVQRLVELGFEARVSSEVYATVEWPLPNREAVRRSQALWDAVSAGYSELMFVQICRPASGAVGPMRYGCFGVAVPPVDDAWERLLPLLQGSFEHGTEYRVDWARFVLPKS